MNNRRQSGGLFYSTALVVTALLLIMSAAVQADDDHLDASRLVEAGEILPLEIILQKVRQLRPGKVIEVELESDHNLKIYEIELLGPDGIVLKLELNASTGELIKIREHD